MNSFALFQIFAFQIGNFSTFLIEFDTSNNIEIDGYSIAIQALKSEGGMLHIHGLAAGGEEDEWALDLANQLEKLGSFTCSVVGVERVKWYAPHQRHIVVDIHASPVSC